MERTLKNPAAVLFRAASATVEVGSAAVAIATLSVATGIVRLATSLDTWVVVFLVSKPLVDLTWQFKFLEFSEQNINPQALMGLLAVAFTGVALFWKRRQLVHNKAVVGLCLLAIVSLAATPTSWGFNELIRLYACLAFFFSAGLVLGSEERFDSFANLFLLAVSVPVVLSYLQEIGLFPYYYWDTIGGKEVGRATGTYQHPLGIVYLLMYAIPFALYLFDKNRSRLLYRMGLLLFMLLALVALGLTYHRSGQIAILLEIGVWMLLTRKNAKYYLAAGAIAVGITMAVFWQFFSVFYRPLTDAFSNGFNIFDPDFLRGRGMNWFLFLYSFYKGGPIHWLIGLGGSVAEGYVPGLGFLSSNEPHNDFIRILHAYGLLGLGLYFAILGRIFQASRQLRRSGDRFSAGMGTLGLSLLPCILLLSITTEPMRYPAAVWYLFSVASVIEVRSQLATQNSANGELR